MSHHIVEAKNVEYIYPDGTKALKKVSFRITHGESVAIVGANGSGKSTLLLHLNGTYMPSKGEVYIGEFPIRKKNIHHVRRAVGMVFSNPDDQLFMPTVYEDVAFGPLNLGCPKDILEKKVDEALEKVGSLPLKHRPPYKLSAGEKRAVSIATVLAMDPSIIVMDEPSVNLDPKNRRRLITLLKTFPHTKIIATHDLDLALDLCPRTIVLNRGEILADSQSIEIFQNQKLLEEAHLEPPLRMQACPICKQKTKE